MLDDRRRRIPWLSLGSMSWLELFWLERNTPVHHYLDKKNDGCVNLGDQLGWST